jgi:hypothetical protein
LKSADKYQLNSLTKFLFDKAGFTTLFTDDTYPKELANNGCLALKVVVEDNSSMFSTKMKIKLLDCHNIVVYTTKESRSKEKEYKKAYHDALRKAFEEIYDLNYSYDGSLNNESNEVIIEDGEIQVVKDKPELSEELINLIVESRSNEKEVEPEPEEEVEKVKEKKVEPVPAKEVEKVKEKKIEPVAEKEVKKVASAKTIEPLAEKQVKVVAVVGIDPVVEKKVEKVEKKTKQPEKKEQKKIQNEQNESKNLESEKEKVISLEGKFDMDQWGICTISKKDNIFSVVGGDENFEFAKVFETSKPSIYIIKWAAYKQPQLLEIVDNGNLKVDTEDGIKIYKRAN